ncbi:hypothetical protein BMF94_2822 [Rhodotorula taiwanensis]|uniref:RRM domain-containing protein n=1 Tax=Rhodotorula taiwanensis TaxID=741276 RepID=A0A2S5BBA8_9BASI|nr:hypothetical protein BMF94_2822 [Rhodotorula taiwanensis]
MLRGAISLARCAAPARLAVPSQFARSFSRISPVVVAVAPPRFTFAAPRVSLLHASARLQEDVASSAPTESSTVFVGQLSWNIDNEWLESEFEQYGEIKSAKVVLERDSGRSRGFGYVEFATPEAAKKALEMAGKEVDGRHINVDIATPRPAPRSYDNASPSGARPVSGAPTATLFVANLPFSATEGDVSSAFEDFGEVLSVRLPVDGRSGLPKGFGYVEFQSVEQAKAAIEAAGPAEGTEPIEIDGRMLRLDYSQPRPERSERSDRSYGGGGGRGGRFDGGGRGRGGSDRYGGDRERSGGFRGGRDNYERGGGERRRFGGGDRERSGGYGRQRDDYGGGRDNGRRERY